jgi:hypothetical protein
MSEPPFEKSVPRIPADIFQAIADKSVNRMIGENLIKQYGDRRAMEALIEYQKTQGVELDKEIKQRIFRLEKLLDELYEKSVSVLGAAKPEGGKARKGVPGQ